MKKIDGQSLDMERENILKLSRFFNQHKDSFFQVFPDIRTEGKIDFEKLQLILGGNIEEEEERYNFTWHGKRDAIRMSQTPTRGTLRPDKENSKNWDETKNLYIEGDNLEVLKLLQKSYHGKIKMIYIDPPYNTGKDFVYKDNYRDNIKNYLDFTGQIDEGGKKTSTNVESSGRYHTDWLNMIYPRLRLARNLLAEDGVIFISIDDNEIHNLKKTCDEIFGEDNLEAIFYIKVRHENRILREDIRYQLVIEHLLCYSKSKLYTPNRRPKDRKSEEDYIYDIEIKGQPSQITNINGYEVEIYKEDAYQIVEKEVGHGLFKKYQIRGSLISQSGSASEYYEMNLRTRRKEDGLGALYKVLDMGTRGDGLGYRYIMQPQKPSSKNGFYFQGRPISQKRYNGIPFPNYFDYVVEFNNVGYEGGVEFKNGKKPIRFIQDICNIANIASDKEAIILDFFAGSSTTAHALMDLNAEDGGNRRFIMVQLPEAVDESSQAKKAGYETIADIGRERIRRAGQKILEDNKDKKEIENLDTGFRSFKLDTSNIKEWNPRHEEGDLRLEDYIDNFVAGRQESDILYEIILKYGIDLSASIEKHIVHGKIIYNIDFGSIYICLDNDINNSVVEEILKLNKKHNKPNPLVVFKDIGFKNDQIKLNAKLSLKDNGIKEVVSI